MGFDAHTGRLYADKRQCLELMTKARQGDHIVITKLNRLGRNTSDMIRIIEDLHERGITVQFLDDGISTEGAMGKMVTTILRSPRPSAYRSAPMKAGGAAMARGVKMGRKPSISQAIRERAVKMVSEVYPRLWWPSSWGSAGKSCTTSWKR